jgi:hypothetical protein
MNRREALSSTMALLGVSIIGADAFLSGCAPKSAGENTTFFNDEMISLLDTIGETIIPATAESPGAKDAKIGQFMKLIVSECYTDDEERSFVSGMEKFKQDVKQKFGKAFSSLSDDEKNEWLITLDNESRQSKPGKDTHIFEMLNQLTLWGYFSSEPGATKALRFVPIPGEYKGCIDYHRGEGAWIY